MLTLRPNDRRLLEQVNQQLQSVAALVRGMLASQPRPVPPGDWGRAPAAPPVERAPLVVGPRRIPDPPRPTDEPLEPEVKWHRHTPESIAADRALVLACLDEMHCTVSFLATKAGIKSTGLYRARHGQGGLPRGDREQIQKVLEWFRATKEQIPQRTKTSKGATP